MYVVKRDGRQEAVHFDKITARLKKLSYGLTMEHCDPVLVSQKVCAGVYKGVTTSQLDELAAETAAAMTANHPDYASVSLANIYLLIIFFFDPGFCFFDIFCDRFGLVIKIILAAFVSGSGLISQFPLIFLCGFCSLTKNGKRICCFW